MRLKFARFSAFFVDRQPPSVNRTKAYNSLNTLITLKTLPQKTIENCRIQQLSIFWHHYQKKKARHIAEPSFVIIGLITPV